MKLAVVTGGEARCLLCGWDYSDRTDAEAEKVLLGHLNLIHARYLLSKEENRNVWSYHGPRYANDYGLQPGHGRPVDPAVRGGCGT
jgi:hypothetical protein